MPRTANLPSDLIDTQARFLARTVTSNVWLPAALALPRDNSGLAVAAELGLVISDDGAACLIAVTSPDFGTGTFKSTAVVVAGLACTDVFGLAAVVVPGVSTFVVLETGEVDVVVIAAGFVGAGVSMAAGVVATPDPLAMRLDSRSRNL